MKLCRWKYRVGQNYEDITNSALVYFSRNHMRQLIRRFWVLDPLVLLKSEKFRLQWHLRSPKLKVDLFRNFRHLLHQFPSIISGITSTYRRSFRHEGKMTLLHVVDSSQFNYIFGYISTYIIVLQDMVAESHTRHKCAFTICLCQWGNLSRWE